MLHVVLLSYLMASGIAARGSASPATQPSTAPAVQRATGPVEVDGAGMSVGLASRLALWNARYDNWTGPTKSCPVCNGTGFSDASRKKDAQRVSPSLADIFGTGQTSTLQSGSHCEMCYGTGHVPDYGKQEEQ